METAGAVPVVRPLPINRRFTDHQLDAAAAKAASTAMQNGRSNSRRHTFHPLQRQMSRKSSSSPPLLEGTAAANGRAIHIPQRQCPCARVVQFSVKTALHLPSTQLALCPQPLRKKLFFHAHRRGRDEGAAGNITNQYRMEENGLDFYPEAPSFGEEDEELSSGDEDELDGENARGEVTTPTSNADRGEEASGKLAFGRRKLKFFDQITARDREEARSHLKIYWKEVYTRRFAAKLHHLQQGLPENDIDGICAAEKEAGVGEVELPSLSAESSSGFTSQPHGQTSGSASVRSELAAALILESMKLCPLESMEGMAECYDGLVAAGAALMEHAERESQRSPSSSGTPDSQRSSNDPSDPTSGISGNSSDGGKLSSSPLSVLSTLTPLLITTLEPTTGEAILLLAELHNMCATTRYKKRLIQRIAPHLIRPSNAAMWCLKHQNDMPAIVAVTDLLLSRASDIFPPNWVERGKLLKADGLRAENLRLAALQLKNLNNRRSSLQLSLSSKAVSGATGSTSGGGGSSSSSSHGDGDKSHLAEWEVLAVDRYIRTSIRHVFERTWVNMKPAKYSNAGGRGMLVGNTSVASSSSSVGTSSGSGSSGGGCPMSPRKIPLSPSTFANAASASNTSSNSSTGLPQVESLLPSAGGNASPSGLPPSSANAVSGTGITSEIPQTPKPSSLLAPLNTLNNTPTVGTPPRSPCSPPKATRSITAVPGSSGDANSTVSSAGAQSPAQSSSQYAASSSSSRKGHLHTQIQPVIHHTLTRNSEERKRTVAACRALRTQIARFEEAFAAIHGRAPKGATERAPLATTYAQYREWKRAIRADAATRIQALFRGARCRWMLLRASNPRLARVIRRSGSIRGRGLLGQLSIPVEIGGELEGGANGPVGMNPMMDDVMIGSGTGPPGARAGGMHMNMDVEERSCQSSEGVELVITRSGSGGSSKKYARGADRDHGRSSGGKLTSPPGTSSSGPSGWNLGMMRKSGANKRDGSFPNASTGNSGWGDQSRAHLLGPNGVDGFPSVATTTESTSTGSADGLLNPNGKSSNLQMQGSGGSAKKSQKYGRPRNSAHQPGGAPFPYSGMSGGSSVDSDNESDASSRGSFSNSGGSFGDASLQDLLTQKKELKAQLKSYDMNFARKHGRMPVKAEKEPIRNLYEQYNSLKSQISLMEGGGGSATSSANGSASGQGHHGQHRGARGVSSGGSVNSSSAASYASSNSHGSSDRSVDSSEDDSSRGNSGPYSSRRRDRSKSSGVSAGSSGSHSHPGTLMDSSGIMDSAINSQGSASAASVNSLLSQDLSSLRAEKGTLHQMLRSYEREFFREHNRQVSSFADIRPVAAQYRRYKEIKKAIAAKQAEEK